MPPEPVACPVCQQQVECWAAGKRDPIPVMRWHQRPLAGDPGKRRRCPGSNLTPAEASTVLGALTNE